MRIDRRASWDLDGRIRGQAGVSGSAVVVGDRAGMVEWASEGWYELTGCALERAAGKPILDFIRSANPNPELVDFVADCFSSGRPCEIEVAHAGPDGCERWVRLRVEPVFDSLGEVSDFVAIATDTGQDEPFLATGLLEVDLSEMAARAARRHRPRLGANTLLDVSLDADLPLVLAEPERLEGLIERLICRAAEAISDSWGTLTITTGLLGRGVQPLYRSPLEAEAADRVRVFLEVHDTGSAAPSGARRNVTEPFLNTLHAEDALSSAMATRLLHRFGGDFHIDNDPGIGTSVVIVLPCFLA